jgi:hypothetical protein
MRPLLEFTDDHPLGTGVVGASSGLLAWLFKELHLVATVAADVGMLFAVATAVVTFSLQHRKLMRDRREEALARLHAIREHRRRHLEEEEDPLP